MKLDFVIVGGPKCGTTSLWSYLKQHPDIFFPEMKEPHFYCTDLGDFRKLSDLWAYETLFDDSKENQLCGEASVFYSHSDEAIENIYESNTKAKLILMIRNPIEMIPSLHSQLLYTFDEDKEQIEIAWELQDNRALGSSIPKKCRHPKLLQYKEIASFGKQIQRILNVFPMEQVHIINFDDFKNETENEFQKVLEFLNLESIHIDNFKRVNPNKTHKNKAIGKFVNNPPKALTKIVPKIKKIFGINKIGLFDYIEKNNRSLAERKSIQIDFKNILKDAFKDDIQLLERLLKVQLDHWLD